MESIVGRCKDGSLFNRHITAFGIILVLSMLSVSFTDRALIQIDFNYRGKVNNKTDTQRSIGSESMSHIQNDANFTLGEGDVIRYGLFRNRPYLDSQFEDKYLCNWNESTLSTINFPDVPSGVFDFTVHIATKLKILFIGDSLALQFSIWFEKACGVIAHKKLAIAKQIGSTADLVNVANEINGGGAIAFWRIIGVWIQKFQGQPGPNRGEKTKRRRGGLENDTARTLLGRSMQ